MARDGTVVFLAHVKSLNLGFGHVLAFDFGIVFHGGSDVVRDGDPTNNVPDSIFGKLGMQLHRRENHPLGILKDAIYGYFDAKFEGKFVKFDNLCPIVTVKQVRSSGKLLFFFFFKPHVKSSYSKKKKYWLSN